MEEERELSLDEKYELYREKKDAEKKSRKKKTAIWLMVLLLLICVLLVLWQNRERILPENFYEKIRLSFAGKKEGDGYPHMLKGNTGETGVFFCKNGNLVLLSDTAFEVLNQKGTRLMEGRISFSQPAAALSETRCLLYGIGEKPFRIEGVSGTVLEGTSEKKIIAADISEKGKFMLATESDSHVSEIAVYMPDGSLQYSYKFSSCYITDVAISSDGKTGAVCGLYSTGGTLKGQIYIFDFGNPEPVVFQEKDEMLFFDVEWNGKTATCMGQTGVFYIDADGKDHSYSFGGKELISYDIYDGRAAFVLDDYQEQRLFVTDMSGKVVMEKAVSGGVKDLAYFGDTAAVFADRSISIYSTVDAGELAAFETENDARRILLGDVNTLYIVNRSSVEQKSF